MTFSKTADPSESGWNPRRASFLFLLSAVLLLAIATVLSACGEAEDEGEGGDGEQSPYTDISAEELAAMLENKDFLLINTHIPYEGDIPQTDLFIPYDEAAEHLDQLPEDKDAKIVVYCRSDNMSRQAAEVWAEAGYTNLYNLEGGFVAWQEAGYEMVRNEW
ncbi:MAG: hypothetical protein Kow00129_14130 [Thermoleophilia bacterium]